MTAATLMTAMMTTATASMTPTMGLDKSTLIYRWRCDASWALKVAHRHFLHYRALLKVIIIDLLNN